MCRLKSSQLSTPLPSSTVSADLLCGPSQLLGCSNSLASPELEGASWQGLPCACDAYALCFAVDVIGVKAELHYFKCPIFPTVALRVTG